MTERELLTERLDLGMTKSMSIAVSRACDMANHGMGTKPNPWIKTLIARELNEIFGPEWVNFGSGQDVNDDSE